MGSVTQVPKQNVMYSLVCLKGYGGNFVDTICIGNVYHFNLEISISYNEIISKGVCVCVRERERRVVCYLAFIWDQP